MKIINKNNKRITFPDLNFSIGPLEVKTTTLTIFNKIKSRKIIEVKETVKTVEKKVDRQENNK